MHWRVEADEVKKLAVEEKIYKARLWLQSNMPAYAFAILSLRPIVTDELPTFAVDDHWRLYVNPDYALSMTDLEAGGVLMHEVNHLLRSHGPRRGSRHPTGWNIAGDLEINDDLAAEHVALPEGALQPNEHDLPIGETAETYFRELAERNNQQPQPQQGQGQQGQGQPQQGQGQGAKSLADAACAGGSGATGLPATWEEVREGEPEGADPIEAKRVRQVTARAVESVARAAGKDPADWALREIAAGKAKRVNWDALRRSALGRALDASKKTDYTFARANRRSGSGITLPGHYGRLPVVKVVLDDSGSMSERDLSTAFAAIKQMVKASGLREDQVEIITCDVEASKVKDHVGRATLRIAGGGGTDMRVGIKFALEERPKPSAVVVLTDGYTPWPDHAPRRTPFIVGLVGRGGSHPSWAKAVPLDDEAAEYLRGKTEGI